MRFLFLPVPGRLRLSPLGVAMRGRITRKAGGGGKSDPESGSKKGEKGGVRVLGRFSERRRQQMLAHWLKTRRVESGMKKKKGAGGAVAAGLAGGAVLKGEFDVTAQMVGRVYRDLKRPMASG